MEQYARDLLAAYPPARFANSADGITCNHCRKRIGLADGECTGWHPVFKCECGFETSHPAAAKWQTCVECGRAAVSILDAEIVE